MAEKLRAVSDFNDLHVRAGLDAVRDQIEHAVALLLTRDAANDVTDVVADMSPFSGDYYDPGAVPEYFDEPPAPSGGGVGLFDDDGRYRLDVLLDNFWYIYGTKHCWDNLQRQQMELANLGHMVGRDKYKSWMQSPRRRMVMGLKFEPGQDVGPDYVNLFEGWGIEPVAGDCSLLLEHVMHLCGGRQEEADWLLNWLAYPLQFPGTKMASAVLVHGAEGTGKSITFSDVMGRIYGDHHITIGQAQLESSFTEWQSRRLFATAEEVVSRTERSHYKGMLKHLVTGQTLQIDQKHMSLREETNHMNMVFLSNSTQPLELDIGDRRFMVLYVDRVPPADYFERLFRQIDNGGVEAFFHHLLNRDLSGFGPHSKPPLNAEKRRLVNASMLSPQYFFQLWRAGELSLPVMCATTGDLFLFYKHWAESANEFRRTQRYFSQELARCDGISAKRVCIKYPKEDALHTTQRVWVVDDDAGVPRPGESGNEFVGRRCREFRLGLVQVGVVRGD